MTLGCLLSLRHGKEAMATPFRKPCQEKCRDLSSSFNNWTQLHRRKENVTSSPQLMTGCLETVQWTYLGVSYDPVPKFWWSSLHSHVIKFWGLFMVVCSIPQSHDHNLWWCQMALTSDFQEHCTYSESLVGLTTTNCFMTVTTYDYDVHYGHKSRTTCVRHLPFILYFWLLMGEGTQHLVRS